MWTRPLISNNVSPSTMAQRTSVRSPAPKDNNVRSIDPLPFGEGVFGIDNMIMRMKKKRSSDLLSGDLPDDDDDDIVARIRSRVENSQKQYAHRCHRCGLKWSSNTCIQSCGKC